MLRFELRKEPETKMVAKFKSAADFKPVLGWELYQITLDKWHVMFLFNNGWNLLNVAAALSHRTADNGQEYFYDIYGERSALRLERLLREHVVDVRVSSSERLTLQFSNGDELSIHDNSEICSWWFIPIDNPSDQSHAHSWSISDMNPEDM